MNSNLPCFPGEKRYQSNFLSSSCSHIRKAFALTLGLITGLNAFGQTGTWSKVTNNAPNPNMGVMLLMTDGTVLAHNSVGGTVGKGWDKLTPDATGSYINGTWTTVASMANDRLFFPTQVLPNGKVFAAGGEYGAGATHGEVYDPVANTWTATGAVPSGQNIYDGNSQILANGTVLVGIQNGLNPSFNNAIYNPGTNAWVTAPNSPQNHDEAAWLKLPDGSILFVGIGTTASCRYIPGTNSWVADAACPVNLYDPYGEEAGAAIMLPNGKAIFFGATGHNAIYTPSGNTSPGTWTTAVNFPIIGGRQMGTIDAPAAMMPNGKILCAASPVNTSSANQFLPPTYFFEYDYTTNTFAQVTSQLPGLAADSLDGINCDFTTFLLLPNGSVLLGVNQASISQTYWIYTPVGANIPQGKPVINSIYQTACGNNFYMTGKLFNGISEGAAFGDDWAMSTNYPIVRLTNGTNTYYAKTTNWNRIGAVRTDSLEDTTQFAIPAALPVGTYTLVVIANGFPSSPYIFNTWRATTSVLANVSCNGGTNGNAQVNVLGGNAPYTYSWSNGSTTNPTGAVLGAGTYTVTVTDHIGCTTTATVTITQPSALTVTTGSIVNATCFGGTNGSAVATAAGGTTAYTYSWSPSGGTAATASGLSAGTYTIHLTDNHGCTATATAVVGQPTALTATTTVVNENCNGGNNGSATVTAGGGTPLYTYSWSPSGGTGATASSLTAGTYTIHLTDSHGCTTTSTAVVGQPSALTASTTVVNASCNGGSNGSATVTAGGGTGAYTYSWSPSGGTGATASSLSAGTYTIHVTDNHGCTTTGTAVVGQPVAITATTSVVNVSCNGGSNGSATVTASGGVGAYTYSWSPSGGTGSTASGLSASTYTVSITDNNGCNTTATAVVGQPAVLSGSVSATNVSCFGGSNGSATASVTGGTGPYTYSWSPSGGTGATASGLGAGTYTVSITDNNGCNTSASTSVTAPSTALSASISSMNVACNGASTGSSTVTAAGGTGAYTYSWSPSGGTAATASSLNAGTYTVNITDNNGCTDTLTTVITQPPALTVTTSTPSQSVCPGGCATLSETTGGGTPPYTYSWSNLATTTTTTVCPASSTTYTVTSTDGNGCTQSATAYVMVLNPGTVTASSADPTPCVNALTDALTGSPVGGTFSGTAVSGNNFNPSLAGQGTFVITYSYTDLKGCHDTTTTTINVNLCTGINEHIAGNFEFDVYPNPFNDQLTVKLEKISGKTTLEIFNMLGKQVYMQQLVSPVTEIDMSALPSEIYMIRITTDDGFVTKKVLKAY